MHRREGHMMRRLKKWFLNLRIQRKFLYCFLGITVAVLLAASVSIYLVSSKVVMEQNEKQSFGLIHELSINQDHYFGMIEHSFDYIANNTIVQDELKSDSPYRTDGGEFYSYFSRAGQIRRLLLQGYTSVYMNDIRLYGYNGAEHLLYTGERPEIHDEETVLQKAEEANGSCVYYNDSEETGLIYIAKQIKDSLTMQPLGFLLASIKINYLEKMTEVVKRSLSAEIIMLDNENQVILNGIDEGMEEILEQMSDVSGNFAWKNRSGTYNCVYQKSLDTGFTLVGIVPTDFLYRTAGELLKFSVLLLIVSAILCVVLSLTLAKGISAPIELTSSAMKRFAEGDFTVRLPEGREDEIGTMNMVFNTTIQEVETLLKKLVDMERANKDIEFQALQAQINPHFLYNVLDTINWMARRDGEETICRMVTAISNIMRVSISNRQSIIAIRDEMKYVRDYLYIQETRYEDKFVADIGIDEELNNILIPKMTVQTLVENAVVHGVENATWDCFLSIEGRIEENMAVIQVRDNGVGMSEEKLRSVLNPEERNKTREEDQRPHTHLGVYAVKKRLDYLYDGRASMEITAEEGKGTLVTLKIPTDGIRRIETNGDSGNDIG